MSLFKQLCVNSKVLFYNNKRQNPGLNMNFEIICFDCDSTLSRIEGIDELARDSGRFDEVAALTHLAMNGEIKLEDIYGKRLEIIRPNRSSIQRLSQQYIAEIVDGTKETVDYLIKSGKQIHIVSGGIRQAILPLAAYLSIPADRVHAVDIFFDQQDQYLAFDHHSCLAKSGGKAAICRQLMQQSDQPSMVMIGDGKTDLEAQQAGAYVIGFGGVVKRDLVQAQADFYVSESSLLAVLPCLSGCDSNRPQPGVRI